MMPNLDIANFPLHLMTHTENELTLKNFVKGRLLKIRRGNAGWPRWIRFGIYRGGAAGRGLLGKIVSRVNLLCQGTPVGSKASQPVPPTTKTTDSKSRASDM